MIDRKVFFDIARKRLFGNTLTQGQVAGIDAVLDEWEKRKLTDLRWLAYMLATDKHETNATMLAVREAYWLSEEWRKAHLRYWPYYGRGLVQLTWRENYDKMGKFLNLPLADNPDLALDLGAAVQVMFEGMLKAETGVGDFTGRCLEQFFNDQKDDPVGARAIINGTDKAQLIAGYHHDFLVALKAATERKAA
jgi:putative chitinase